MPPLPHFGSFGFVEFGFGVSRRSLATLSLSLTSLENISWRRVQSLFGAASSAETYCIRDSGNEICERDANGREVELFQIGGFLFYAFAIGVFARELVPAEAAGCTHSHLIEIEYKYPAFGPVSVE